MAETLAQVDAQKTQDAESAVADFLFGKEEEELAEAGPNVQVEGDDVSDDDTEEVEAKDEAEETEDQTVEIEVDGELLVVPEKYKDYFMRTADYTQKTQEVASQRKELEVKAGQIRAAQQQNEFAQSIQNELIEVWKAQQAEEQYVQYLRTNAADMSAQEITQVQLEIDRLRQEQGKKQKELNSKWEEHQQAVEQSVKELRDKSTEVLRSKIPGWNEKSEAQLREYALSAGLSEQAYDSSIDPLEKEIIWKAMRYDSLKKGAEPAVQKVKEAPQIKPKARDPMPKEVQDKLNLRKKLQSGKLSTNEKAKIIESDIGSRWFGQ